MSHDPILDLLKAQADATRKKQNLPTQRTIGAAPPKPYGAKLRDETTAEKIANFTTGGASGHVVNAIDRARMGDYSGSLSEAGKGAGLAAAQAVGGKIIGAGTAKAGKFLKTLAGPETMTMADLPERYAILTGDNPGGVPGDAASNAASTARIAAAARAMGKKVTPVAGAYTDDKTGQLLHENSLLIHDIGEHDAKALGRMGGQNSIVTQKGLHDLTTGDLFPSKGINATKDAPYTELPGGQRFSHDLDFENPVKAAPSHAVEMTKSLMQSGPIFNSDDIAASQKNLLGGGSGPELPGAVSDSVAVPLARKLIAPNLNLPAKPTQSVIGAAEAKVLTPEQIRAKANKAWAAANAPVDAYQPTPAGILVDRRGIMPD